MDKLARARAPLSYQYTQNPRGVPARKSPLPGEEVAANQSPVIRFDVMSGMRGGNDVATVNDGHLLYLYRCRQSKKKKKNNTNSHEYDMTSKSAFLLGILFPIGILTKFPGLEAHLSHHTPSVVPRETSFCHPPRHSSKQKVAISRESIICRAGASS